MLFNKYIDAKYILYGLNIQREGLCRACRRCRLHALKPYQNILHLDGPMARAKLNFSKKRPVLPHEICGRLGSTPPNSIQYKELRPVIAILSINSRRLLAFVSNKKNRAGALACPAGVELSPLVNLHRGKLGGSGVNRLRGDLPAKGPATESQPPEL